MLVETPVDSLTTKVIMVNVMLVVARGAAPQQLMYPERHADSRPRSMPLLTLFHMGVLHHSNQPDLPAGARRKPNVLSDQLPRQASSTKVADPRGQLGRNPSWSPRRPAASGSPPPRLDLAHRHPYSLRPSLRLESRNDWEQSQEDVTAEVGTTVLRRVQRRLLQRMEGNLELLEVEYASVAFVKVASREKRSRLQTSRWDHGLPGRDASSRRRSYSRRSTFPVPDTLSA